MTVGDPHVVRVTTNKEKTMTIKRVQAGDPSGKGGEFAKHKRSDAGTNVIADDAAQPLMTHDEYMERRTDLDDTLRSTWDDTERRAAVNAMRELKAQRRDAIVANQEKYAAMNEMNVALWDGHPTMNEMELIDESRRLRHEAEEVSPPPYEDFYTDSDRHPEVGDVVRLDGDLCLAEEVYQDGSMSVRDLKTGESRITEVSETTTVNRIPEHVTTRGEAEMVPGTTEEQREWVRAMTRKATDEEVMYSYPDAVSYEVAYHEKMDGGFNAIESVTLRDGTVITEPEWKRHAFNPDGEEPSLATFIGDKFNETRTVGGE